MRLLLRYLLLLAAGTVAVVLTAMIPRHAVEAHLRTSINHLATQEEYPTAFGLPFLRTDNFTDLLMLNEAWCSNDTHPVNASMLNNYFLAADGDLFQASQLMLTEPVEQLQLSEYSRYWHGIQVVLRPLLVLTDYRHLIIANCILLSLLALWCLCEVWQHCSLALSIAFAVVLLLVAFPAVPLCIQYSVCFYIMFAFVIALLRSKGQRHDACSFFTVGALTAFFDLLTTPLLTLGIPLLIYMCNLREHGRMKRVTQLVASWFMGYAVFWLSKCLVAWLLTGHNILGFFMDGVVARSLLGLNTFRHSLASHPVLCVATTVLTCFLIYFGMRRLLQTARQNAFLQQYGWLLFVAAMPILWFALLLQHTSVHFFFVWRTLAITLLAAMMLLIPSIRSNLKTTSYHDE